MAFNFGDYIYLTIPEGEVKQITDGSGQVIWKRGYVNQVPRSTDTDGSIYNGTGYKDNVRLSSSGGVSGSAQNGSTTTGFIPFNGAAHDVVRMKGVEWKGVTSGHHYFNYYDANKKFLTYISASLDNDGAYSHIFTTTRDANGVETAVWNKDYGTSNSVLQLVRQASYIRITAKGSGANMIVTINEEIN